MGFSVKFSSQKMLTPHTKISTMFCANIVEIFVCGEFVEDSPHILLFFFPRYRGCSLTRIPFHRVFDTFFLT